MNNKQECTSCSFEEKLKCKKFNWRIYPGDRCDYYKPKEVREDMDNDIEDLKPCPWCGGKAYVQPIGIFFKKYYIDCDCALGCPVMPKTWSYSSEDVAVQHWNSMNEYHK